MENSFNSSLDIAPTTINFENKAPANSLQFFAYYNLVLFTEYFFSMIKVYYFNFFRTCCTKKQQTQLYLIQGLLKVYEVY